MTPLQPIFSASLRARQRKDGTTAWDVRFRENGRQRTVAFESEKAATKWANILRAIGPTDALAMLTNETVGNSPTVDEYATRYILSKSGVEGKTTDDYRSFMRLHISPTLGPLPIDAIGPDAIAAWINGQVKQGAASKSIKNRHGFLAAMFQAAVDDGVISRNPCAKSRLPEMEHLEMVFLSADEFAQLLSFIPAKHQPLVLLLATTGLRWGEATALRPGDFDLVARTVRVSRAWKRSADLGYYIGPPKTGRSRRTVSLADDVCELLRPLIEAGNEYVFVNSAGGPVRQAKFWELVWVPARRMANGLPAFEVSRGVADKPWEPRRFGVWADREPAQVPLGKWPRVHDLRHSHASWLLAAGIPLATIQRRLGHESIETTSAIYSHLSPDMLRAPADAIGRVLAGSMPQLEG